MNSFPDRPLASDFVEQDVVARSQQVFIQSQEWQAEALRSEQSIEEQTRAWLEQQEQKEQQAARNAHKKNITIASLAIGIPTAGITGAILSLRSPSGTKQPAPTLAAIKSIDPLTNADAFVNAAKAASPDVKIQVIQDVSSVITTKNNLAHDFAGMAQTQSLYGTAGKVVDTRFIAQLQNFGGSAATEATNTNASILRDMLGNAENMQHFRDIASGDAMLLNTLNNLPQDPQKLNAIVAQLSDLEYTRLQSLSGVDFHKHFEEAFNAGGATSMKQAVAQLKDTFKGYGEKFTEQVRALQETLQKISPRSSAVSDGDRVLVASAGSLDGLITQLPATPPPPNALQQTFSFLQGKAHESLEAMESAAKATGKFVQENASALTAASAAVTLVRAHIETTQQNLDAKATFKERVAAALTAKVDIKDYAKTMTKLPYAMGLARTAAMAAVAITPAAMGIAATIGAVQMAQTGAGVAAAFTNAQINRTAKRLSDLQTQEGAAEQIAQLTDRQERLQNLATALDTVANASWGDVRNAATGTAQHITTAASATKDATFAKARDITESVQKVTKTVLQSCLGNIMARFSKSQDLAHA